MNTEELRQRLTFIVAETPVNQCWTLSTVHLLKLVEDAVEAEREKVAKWMMDKGYATGHGDTIEDLLKELEWQVAEREEKDND